MKAWKKIGLLFTITFVTLFLTKPVQAQGLEIQMSDVITVLKNCLPYLIALVCVLMVGIIVSIRLKKFEKKKRKFFRWQTLFGTITSAIVTLNLLFLGPLSTLLDVVVNPIATVKDSTKKSAESLVKEIAGEGAVLLKNDKVLPLSKDTKKINVFGWAATNPLYGGTGSGAVDTNNAVSLVEGIESAGYEVNQTLLDMYGQYAETRPEATMSFVDWTLPEPTREHYTDSILKEAENFSDTAVVVLSRIGGEGTDLPTDFGAKNADGSPKYTYTNNSDKYDDFKDGQHYLEISQTERDLLQMVGEKFENVVVVVNSSNAMELGFINEIEGLDSLLVFPSGGETGFAALGELLNGTITPSGKLSDTIVYDLTKTPGFNNFGSFAYENMDEFGWLEVNPMAKTEQMNQVHFVNYSESIYVGYKFYETAYEEAQKGNMNFDYNQTVQFPFGAGLSYTTFKQSIVDFTSAADGIDVTVEVENTGNMNGKDVVELYVNPPYTNGGIEKSAVNLVDFKKTDLLAPGQKQTVKFHVASEDLASFDRADNGYYVLDEGDYHLSIRKDAHNMIDERTYHVDKKVVFNKENPRSTDVTTASKQFEFAEGDVTYLSRKDGFANFEDATAKPTNYQYDEELKANYQNASNYDIESLNNESDQMPKSGISNGLVLANFRGKAYDDELWEKLLDQMTINDLSSLISGGGYQTAAVASIEKVATIDNDGPASIYNNYTKAKGSAYPSEVTLANTWNTELASEMGRSIGQQADELGVSGWYAPAMNIHRTAFGGRNFEYYSEDSLLSGKMAAAEIQGAAEHGVYSYIKHFAFNDQETNRIYQLHTWIDEQAIREIYLKPFELAIKEGKSGAVMAAHNFIGNKWVGASPELNKRVLRDEWGFKGFVSTDMFAGYGYYDADMAIRSGVDSMLSPMGHPDATLTDTTSATSVLAMREAVHNILYTVVNSRAYESGNAYKMVLWKKLLIGFDVVALLALCGSEYILIRCYKREDA